MVRRGPLGPDQQWTRLVTKPRLFLHIGLAKTGTSAIQRFAWENRHLLAEAGVIYPERGVVAGAHHKLSPFIPPSLATAWPYEPIEDWAPALAAEARAAGKPIVLSSELISNAGPGLVRRIAEVLEPVFETRIVVYVRRIDDLLMANFNQQVKAQGQPYAIEDIADVLFYKLRPDKVLAPWIKAFGIENIVVRPYEQLQFASRDLLADFSDAIGVDWRRDFHRLDGDANARLSRNALEYKRFLNNFIGDRAALGEFEAPLLAYSARAEEQTQVAFQGTPLLPGATRLAMIEKLAPFYRRLARQALGRKDGVLFRADLPDAKAPWQPVTLTNDQIDRITREIATPRLTQILTEQREDARRAGDLLRISYAARFSQS